MHKGDWQMLQGKSERQQQVYHQTQIERLVHSQVCKVREHGDSWKESHSLEPVQIELLPSLQAKPLQEVGPDVENEPHASSTLDLMKQGQEFSFLPRKREPWKWLPKGHTHEGSEYDLRGEGDDQKCYLYFSEEASLLWSYSVLEISGFVVELEIVVQVQKGVLKDLKRLQGLASRRHPRHFSVSSDHPLKEVVQKRYQQKERRNRKGLVRTKQTDQLIHQTENRGSQNSAHLSWKEPSLVSK
jgi:hypothetical protein